MNVCMYIGAILYFSDYGIKVIGWCVCIYNYFGYIGGVYFLGEVVDLGCWCDV